MSDLIPYKPGQHPNSRAALIENRAATQFDAEDGNKTSGELGVNVGSYRAAARLLSRQKMVKGADGKMTILLPDEPTVAQYIMSNVIAKASRGDMGAVKYLTEQVDGKVAQANLNADMSVIAGMSDDDIKRELTALREAAARIDARERAADSGEQAADAAGDVGGSSAPGDAASV